MPFLFIHTKFSLLEALFHWIRIDFCRLDQDPEPGVQKEPTKKNWNKLRNVRILKIAVN
jgi:hypothetical protein